MKKSGFAIIAVVSLAMVAGCSSSSSSFSSSSVSSSATISSSLSSSSSASSSSSSSYRPDLLAEKESSYRLSLLPIDPALSSAPIYDVSAAGEVNCSSLGEVIRGKDYIEPYEIASYYQSFGELPPNYSTDRPSVINYPNKMGRLISIYNFRSGGYGGSIGPAKKGGEYYELDIGTPSTNRSYIYHSSIVRGAFRLVVLPRAISYQYPQSGSYDSVIFYTEDHYRSFVEYCNFGNAWSEDFNGEDEVFGSREALSSLSQEVCHLN